MSFPRDLKQITGQDYKGQISRTKQAFSDAADINMIMRKFEKTGTLEGDLTSGMTFGDYDNADDYHTALNKVREAERAFGEMPAEIRARMKNDPGVFMDFVGNPDNLDEGIQLGLFDPPEDWVHPDKREAPAAPEEPTPPAPETDPPAGTVS